MLDNNIFDIDLVNSIRDKLQSDIQVMSLTRALELTSKPSPTKLLSISSLQYE